MSPGFPPRQPALSARGLVVNTGPKTNMSWERIMAKVLIIGASHGIGLETVRAALRAGHSVRALARSAATIPIQDANLDKVSGNALDPDTIRNVLRDINVVIQ